ncbi:MAG: type VII secretion protein EccCa [Beutenbergiaceae bacterium]
MNNAVAAVAQPDRLQPPTAPGGSIELQAPPELVKPEGGGGALMSVIPMLGSVGSIALISFSAGGGSPTRMIMGAGILVASLGFVAVNLLRQRTQHRERVTTSRREYLAYLSDLRDSVRNAARRQRRVAAWHFPDPATLALLAQDGVRVWEREREDERRLCTRLGMGQAPLCIELVPPETGPLAQLDPVAASAAHRFLLTHGEVADLPMHLDLTGFARLEIAGPDGPARALTRAIALHMATFVAPADLQIAVLSDEARLDDWEWLKWLPHSWATKESDQVGRRRLVVTDPDELIDLLTITARGPFSLAADPQFPHVVLIVDTSAKLDPDHPALRSRQGVTIVELPRTWAEVVDPATARLLIRGDADGHQLELQRLGQAVTTLTPDALSCTEAEAGARRLTRYAQMGADGESSRPSQQSAELVDLLDLGDVRDLDVGQSWAPRSVRDWLRVPLGLTTAGSPIYLDLKESAQGGMGPHGLIIGATGSGKSEVLRTLVLALAMTHSSEELNFVLVDFKGGATFAGMAGMPHVSAIITNLGEELSLVDRMQEALRGEMTRRQELLRAEGNFTNVAEYEKARRSHRPDLAPLPALLIVLDEFSELLTAKPEFADLFVAIGRLGRSLQMHLLLSSQRLEEGKLRGLDSHLSYRIGLRTFSASESRTVLGVPDAHTLPALPGVGYLKPDTTTMTQFRAAYVSGPPPRRRRAVGTRGGARKLVLLPFTAAAQGDAPESEPAEPIVVPADEEERATFDIAVERMAGRGPAAHRVWLDPLDTPLTLDAHAQDLVVDPERGLHSPGWRGSGSFLLPVGVVDRPLEQRRETLTVRLSGDTSNLAIVGGPRSGKSTALRTVVAALALTTTPLESQIYVMDFGGGTFAPMRSLPHIAGIATRSEPDVVRRMVAEITGLINAREAHFRTLGIDSIETYRARRVPGVGPDAGGVDDGYGDIFLVIDGWATLRSEFEGTDGEIQALISRGVTYGLHLVASAARWMDFRTTIKDLLGGRLELRMGETSDSEVDRKLAAVVPRGRPGRGLSPTSHHILLSLPRLDGDGDPATLGAGVDDLVSTVTAAWSGPAGPKLRLLPRRITLDEVRSAAEVPVGTPSEQTPVRWGEMLLGIDEAALAPLALDIKAEPHAYLLGDTGSGKSAFLRAYAREAMRIAAPKQLQLFAVDYRRSLLGEIPEEYLAGYMTTNPQATSEVAALAEYLHTRLPGPDVTPAQLRARSWWSGAEVVVLIDDYDLVATSSGNPLTPLVPLLAQARDIGLHVVLTRRSGGASRAMFDPILQGIRDLAAPGILLSGDPGEGPLIGRLKARRSVPGRATIVFRDRGEVTAQLAWTQPSH